jgi:2,5-furandicarboxylate decarboxylase 1
VGCVDTDRRVRDLRSFLDVLKQNGQLHVIEKEVGLEFEIGDVLMSLERKGRGAALFEKIRGHSIPVAGGVLGSQERIALALGCKKDEVVDKVAGVLRRPKASCGSRLGLFR